MHKIAFLDRATIAPSVELRRPRFEHAFVEFDRTTPDQVPERARDATIVVANKVPLRRPALERLPELKLIAVAATGTDAFDLECCKERGITVINVRAYATATVPEHTFALMLALRRSLFAYRETVRAGAWQRARQFCYFDHPINDLRGQTLGIFGEGTLGQAVAEIAKAFGMRPLFAAHKGKTGLGPLYTPFDEVLESADVLTLHCPLTPETRNLFGPPEFRRMKRTAILINTARGGLVDEAALVTALDEGLIAGAAFDVCTTEPPPEDHPLMRLTGRPNFILTPHVAWASAEAQQGLWDQLVGSMELFVAGTPRNVVV